MLILQSNWWLAPIDWFFGHEMGFILGRTHLQFTLRRSAMVGIEPKSKGDFPSQTVDASIIIGPPFFLNFAFKSSTEILDGDFIFCYN